MSTTRTIIIKLGKPGRVTISRSQKPWWWWSSSSRSWCLLMIIIGFGRQGRKMRGLKKQVNQVVISISFSNHQQHHELPSLPWNDTGLLNRILFKVIRWQVDQKIRLVLLATRPMSSLSNRSSRVLLHILLTSQTTKICLCTPYSYLYNLSTQLTM